MVSVTIPQNEKVRQIGRIAPANLADLARNEEREESKFCFPSKEFAYRFSLLAPKTGRDQRKLPDKLSAGRSEFWLA